MSDDSAHQRPRRSRLVVGIFLLLLGGAMLAANLGFGLPVGWWRILPWSLLALGVFGLIVPTRHLDRVGGVWMLATGVYFLMGIYDWWGLGWSGSWPVFVIAAGLGFILQRHDDRPQPPGNGVS